MTKHKQIRRQLDNKPTWQLYGQLYSQLDRQLRSQLNRQLNWQLYGQLISQLWDYIEKSKHDD